MLRSVGRPRGRFSVMVERCHLLVTALAGSLYCNAGDVFLARRLGVSTRSVQRYLLALKKSGRLQRTTFAYMRVEKWSKKRVMKTVIDHREFGLTRSEVLAFRQPVKPLYVAPKPWQPDLSELIKTFEPKVKPKVYPGKPPQCPDWLWKANMPPEAYAPENDVEVVPVRNPYFVVRNVSVEGFGDPKHEGMIIDDRPENAYVVPMGALMKRMAELARIGAEADARKERIERENPGLNKLRCDFGRASIARARAGPPIGTVEYEIWMHTDRLRKD